MLTVISQMILCLLLAALLGFIIGYLFCKMSCAKDECESIQDHTEPQKALDDRHEDVATQEDGVEPLLLDGPRDGQKDNLTRIKGVGVKIEETLNSAGIYHFDQIADWSEENVKWADANIAFPGRVEREQWVEQAKILAQGGETEFSKRVDAGEVSTSKKD